MEALLLWTALAALLSQNFLLPVVSTPTFVEDQKNYYTPDPNAQPPPAVTYPPPYSSGGGSPPTHRPPSHGGGGSTPSHGGTPPSNCGGSPPSGGHHHTSPPSGGGGYYHSPPSTPTPTPTTPYTPTPTPTTPYTPTPTPSTPTPTVRTPPTSPIDPGTPTTPTPGISVPSPPFSFDPNSPPFTCTYWRNHPQLIWGLFGWLGTVGGAFGTGTGAGVGTGTPPIAGANMNLLEALSNTRTDGIGALYREGTAALLNSMAHTRFPYSSNQVRDSFVRGLSSNRAAAAQAQLFKMANEGRMRPRA